MHVCASVGLHIHSIQQDNMISTHTSEEILIVFHKQIKKFLYIFMGLSPDFLTLLIKLWT